MNAGDFLRGPVHGTIQTIRGMCTDELDHMVIDRTLVELDEMVWDFVYPGRVGGVCPDQGGTGVCDVCQPDCPGSSSVDRWHPSNVEWPNEKAPPGPVRTSVNWLLGEDKPGRGALSIGGIQVIPADAYEALYADRGRVLAAARELAEAINYGLNADSTTYPPPDWEARLDAALASFREVDQ